MKKTLIASAIALTSIVTTNASANLAVTSMFFGKTYAASGSINDDGTMGGFQSVDNFFYTPWFATQETAVITNSNGITWLGSSTEGSGGGSWDFSDDIANMGDNQVAVGILWNWKSLYVLPMLAVFDCTSGVTCIGTDLDGTGTKFGGMQYGPFPGSVPYFSGNGNLTAVPVPAAIWLLGSGLIGLSGLARLRKTG